MTTAARTFRAVLGLSTAAMILWSWPLWLEGTGMLFPRVPFVAGIIRPPVSVAFFRFVILLASIIAASLGILPRRATGVALILLAWLIVEDQFRLQPWIYQFLLMSLALAALPTGRAMGLCRLFVIAMYFHSGLSKLDYAFVHEMGEGFLATALGWIGRTPHRLPPMMKAGIILAMPAWEIVVSVGLIFRRTRKVALAGAVLIHLALIAILGPLGLNHSTIVLFWNAALIAETLLLFGFETPPEPSPQILRLASMVKWAFACVTLLPFCERRGFWDTWPSFALYASHNERMTCRIPGGWPHPLTEIPARQEDPAEPAPGNPLLILDLTAWSLAERRVPVYPQGRALNGVAEFLATRYGKHGLIRVLHRGRADPWKGKRREVELIGLDAIRRHGDTYRINAHPMP